MDAEYPIRIIFFGGFWIKIISFHSKEDRETYRHSTSHIMAHAVKLLFPEAKLAIGPAIEEGFYYDFEIGRPFTPEDLFFDEKKMSEIIERDNPFVRKIVSKEECNRDV